jgi:hypothetical protein
MAIPGKLDGPFKVIVSGNGDYSVSVPKTFQVISVLQQH